MKAKYSPVIDKRAVFITATAVATLRSCDDLTMAGTLWLSLVLYFIPASALVWQDGTGKFPAMGWNSWNTFECNISADLFIQQAQAMLDYGFKVCS